MNRAHFIFLLTIFLISCSSPDIEKEKYGEYAPADAYAEGEKHPYYGSGYPWDRRFFETDIISDYHRRGQRQMLDIAEGRLPEALRYCQESLREDPGDLESLFNLAVVQAQMGDVDSAVQTAGRAIQAGLPPERFLAGPRQMLRPLVESEPFREIAARQPTQLLHGPMLGYVSDHYAKFWIRTVEAVPAYVAVSLSPDLSASKLSQVYVTRAGLDYTTVVEMTGLIPATTFYYDLVVDGKSVFAPEYPSFQTYPRLGDSSRFQIAFGGGAPYDPPNERMWEVIGSYSLSAMLLLGDNVYIDLPEMPSGVQDYTYYRRQSRPEFRRMVTSTPIYAIWNEHDSALKGAWLGPFREQPEWKMPLFQIFRQNWNNPGYGHPQWPASYFAFSIGDVDFFMLDGRFYRTNPFDKDPTMLGPVQKEWLLKKLGESKATFKVIASPVPWSPANKEESRDSWNGFKKERREIFDFLSENKIDGVILLSGDRGRTDAWRINRWRGYHLYEFGSSHLTRPDADPLSSSGLFGYNEKPSFGLLTFDSKISDPTLTYQIVSIDNEVVQTLILKKSNLMY